MELCGKRLHGMFPPCVLVKGHSGDCEDGFGGFYHYEPFCGDWIVNLVKDDIPAEQTKDFLDFCSVDFGQWVYDQVKAWKQR